MKHPIPLTVFLIGLFFLSQIVGLIVVSNYVDLELSQQTGKTEYTPLPYGIDRPQVEENLSFLLIVAAVIIGTALLFVLIKFKKMNLWKFWYFFSVLITMSISFAAFLPQIGAAITSLFLSLLKVFKPNPIVHNFTELFVYGGLAAIFVPIMNLFAASMMLILISVYDMYAVWKSKHMVKLAEFQASSNIFAGLFIPYTKKGKPVILQTKSSSKSEGTRSAILGGGDIGFPLIFAGVAMKTLGFEKAVIIAVAASIGLSLLLAYSKKGRFYPAMPFLAAACFIGYGIALLL